MPLILSECQALDRIRTYRRLLIRRLGALALLAVIIALVGHLPSTARWLAPAMPAAAPTWTLITECRIERRLSRELEKLNAATHLIEDDPPPDII